MTDRLQTDVAIIGGGIVGSSAALALRRMGLSVVLMERDQCGARSSGVNYGGVRRQGRPLSQLALAQRAHGIWAPLSHREGLDTLDVLSNPARLTIFQWLLRQEPRFVPMSVNEVSATNAA